MRDERRPAEEVLRLHASPSKAVQLAAHAVRSGDHGVTGALCSGVPPVVDHRCVARGRSRRLHDAARLLEACERGGHLSLAVLLDRRPLGRVCLAVVRHKRHDGVIGRAGQGVEQPACLDWSMLVGITDELDRSAYRGNVLGKREEVAGSDHGRLVNEEHGSMWKWCAVEVEEKARDGSRRMPSQDLKVRGGLELGGGGRGEGTPEHRHAGGHEGLDARRRGVRLPRPRSAGDHLDRGCFRGAHAADHRALLL